MKPRCPEDRPPGVGLYEWILLCSLAQRVGDQAQVERRRIERERERLAARPADVVRRLAQPRTVQNGSGPASS